MTIHPKQDHLIIGQEVFEALRGVFPAPSGIFVHHWADPQTSRLPAQFTPAVIVAYGHDTPLTGQDQQRGGGIRLMFDQEWRVAVAIKDAASQNAGTASLDEAGPIAAKIIQTLAGLSVANGTSTLRWRGSAAPFFSNSLRILPFAFTARLII